MTRGKPGTSSKIKKECKICTKIFFCWPCKERTGEGLYCSKQCQHLGMSHLKKREITFCVICNKQNPIAPPSRPRKTCSKACKIISYSQKMTGKKKSFTNKGKTYRKEIPIFIEDLPNRERKFWYRSIHRKIQNFFGKPKFCEFCKTTDAIDKRFFHWANISGDYRLVRSDWYRLCRPCHSSFDKQKRKHKVSVL